MVTTEEANQFFIDIMNRGRECIPIEIREAVAEAWRVSPCEGMTAEERANWIMGIAS